VDKGEKDWGGKEIWGREIIRIETNYMYIIVCIHALS
jgi:hypothetical protein